MRSAMRAAPLSRERERLVERVRVDGLRAAADRRERLHGHPHDVVLGLLAVSVEPPVCAWKRSACARGFVAPKRSRMIRAQSVRAARNFATSWKKWLWALKKNERRAPNSSGDRPAATAASQ